MIMSLLELKARLCKLYQKLQIVINPLIKFVLSYIVFNYINTAIGYDSRFTGKIIVLLLSAVCAVTPSAVLIFFAIALSLAHLYAASKFLAIFILVVFIVLYGLLLRFTPKLALVVIAIPLLAKYNLHFAVPLFLGFSFNPLAILPTVCGVFVYYIFDVIRAAATREVTLSLNDIVGLYTEVIDAIMENKQMFIMIAIFTLVIVTVYVVRKFPFEYSFEISIAAGVVVNILGFLIADLKYGVTVNVATLIVMSLLSGAIVIVMLFFKRVLDYTAVERVQFEDDDYFYYVKAVPKVNVSVPKREVKHINKKVDYDEAAEQEEEETEDDNSSYFHDKESAYENDVRNEGFNRNLFMKRSRKTADKEMAEYGIEPVTTSYEEPLEYEEPTDYVRPDYIKKDLKDYKVTDYGISDAAPSDRGRRIINDDGDYEEDMTLEDNDDNM